MLIFLFAPILLPLAILIAFPVWLLTLLGVPLLILLAVGSVIFGAR